MQMPKSNHGPGAREQLIAVGFERRFDAVRLTQGRLVLGLGASVVLGAGAIPAHATQEKDAAAVRFNTDFIQDGGDPVDIQAFLDGNSVLPGNYRVDVFVNRALTARRDVHFVRNPASRQVEPCLTRELLLLGGVDPARLPADHADGPCIDLPTTIEFSQVSYQPGSLRLDVSIPQAALSRSARGYVQPALWEAGETAVFSSYSVNALHREQRHSEGQQYYLGLRNGVNLGQWRLRNEASLTDGSRQPRRYRSNRTFAQHDLTALKSQLTLGETYADAQLFDSVRFRGMALASDEAMLPDSQRIYSPTIRGIAETNATVEVRQSGFLLYSGQVAPGPFELSDIYPSGSNGDLEVTVIETDGRRRSFIQAYASLPIMLPAGQLRYSLAMGEYDSNDELSPSPRLGVGTLVYGLNDYVTLGGGLQVAENYRATNLASGVNTGVGAVSLDVTGSRSHQRQVTLSGQSLRVRYANTLEATSTTLALAGYRYSTDRYRSLDEHVEDLRPQSSGSRWGRAKDRLELTLTQVLPWQSASFNMTASEQRDWEGAGPTRQLYLAWNAVWRSLSYSLSLENNQTRLRHGGAETDRRMAVTVTLPLGDSVDAPRLSFNGTRDARGEYDARMGLNGRVPGQQYTYYSVMAGHDSRAGRSGYASLDSTLPYGRFQGGYGQGRGYRNYNLGATGSVVAHAGGVNVGQYLGDTFALVQVPGVKGIGVASYSDVRTARNGYAILPYAQPYRSNWVSLDTRTLGADVELDNAVGQTVPRRGAMPVVRFDTTVGRRVQFHVTRDDGAVLPFGAQVLDDAGRQLAVVDPTSRALVLVEQDAGELRVKWSEGQCRIPFRLAAKDPARAFDRIEAVCR